MDLQADINWIHQEIDKVQDPDLLQTIKGILRFGSKKSAYLNNEKQTFIEGFQESIEQVKLHQKGKIKLKSAKQVLDEL